MILIADSGATKTDWCIGTSPNDCHTVQTEGISPIHQSADDIGQVIADGLVPQLDAAASITDIHFYGAGCIPAKIPVVEAALRKSFPHARIQVESDLLGAARALCGTSAGIACILGTGSNSCAYDGERITANISPLGYVLGDEGSGAVLGKRLVGDCLKHQLPEDICQAFLSEYDLTPATIINKVYREPLAARFLASLTPFLAKHRDREEVHALLLSCFTDFFRRNVMQYAWQGVPVHFTGSIAHYFRPEVEEAAKALGIRIGSVMKSPMQGLMSFHF